MSWFHKHNLELVSRTYSGPVASITKASGNPDVIERAWHGCTTFIWKCSDPSCSEIVTRTVLGAEVKR